MTDLADALFTTPAMAAVFSAEARVRRMLDFEAALARAQARAGVIPPEAAAAIGASCRVELFDLDALAREAAVAGTPVIPLARMLGDLVGGEAVRYVHWGATSQDAIDTGMVLQARDGIDRLEEGLLALGAACASLAERHRATPMAGRTLLQHALPITFGLKAARWLALATRQARRLRELRRRVLVVQLGGAAGTLASLGTDGLRVMELLAEELGLAAPELPWHAERDRVGELAAGLGVVAGAMAKIAVDLALLAQTEVGEASEAAAPGKGGSSALPQKRNPVDATMALAAARLAIGQVPVVLGAMAQEHERAAGAWQAEWAAIPDLFRFTAGALDRVRSALETLEVDADRMRRNLDAAGGLILAEALATALADKVGRPEAQRIVRGVCDRARRDGAELKTAALADERVAANLTPDAIGRALDPIGYLGAADAFVDRALAGYREAREGSSPIGDKNVERT
ncbi:MAG TPA: 3-carboxy-cis,cis-muconate cycloisomerase [Chloroflexota bacterium]|nr:3-carboxy-cis,cis-muconate cycloisomerase [Chloroflexota bacterium]